MRKNGFKILMATVLLLLVSIFFVACGGDNGNGSQNNTDDTGKQQEANGWKNVEVVQKDMYQNLLLGATNSAYELSKAKMDKNNVATVEGKVGMKLNGSELWLLIKGKYDQTDPTKIREKAMLAVELYTSETLEENTKQAGAYVYNNELYFSIGNNKVKFSLKNSGWQQFFPFEMPDITADIANIASLLPQYIKLSSVTGQYRRNSNKEEYKYSVGVDVSQTISGLCQFLNDPKLVSDREMATTIKEFAADVLSIEVAQLERGEVADSSLSVNFVTSGSQLQDVNAHGVISLGQDAQNLIGANKLDIVLQISDVKITRDYAGGTKIPFINDTKGREAYISYTSAIYSVNVPVKRFEGSSFDVVNDKYNLGITTRIFQDDRTDNFFFCEYYDRTSKKVDRAVYFYNDVVYLYKVNDGQSDMECFCHFDVNLSDLASNLVANELGVEVKSEVDPYGVIAYLLKNISLNDKAISVALQKEFYTKVWYNFYDMLTYINSFAPENLYENQEVVDFVKYITDTGEIVFVEFDNSNIVKVIDITDEKLSATIEMLCADSAAHGQGAADNE